MTKAPDFDDGYPSSGECIGPAWQAAWDYLSDGQWHTSAEVSEVTKRWVVPKTISNLLGKAGKRRLVESRIVRTDRRRREYRRNNPQPPRHWT